VPTLSEAASLERLAAHGVPVVEHRLAADPDEAAAAAEALGGVVVAKLCGDGIAHKTERGLVRLGLDGPPAARAAAAELLGLARPDDGPVAVLVARMVRSPRELIAGVATDPQFGAVAMLGVGGVLAEAVADVAFRRLPIDRADAEDLIDDLRTQRLLGPFRGEPPVDRAALADVLLGLDALVAADPAVRSIDVNPLLVVDGRPVAVDALVEVAAGGAEAGAGTAA
jgi:acetyl-CoA synthetase (ADP-forming)